MIALKARKALFWIWLLIAGQAGAFEAFTVTNIKVEGLQRISEGTVFNYLPIKIGDRIDDTSSSNAINQLYATGFFNDIQLLRDGSVLVVRVKERPSIASIKITGNNEISSDELLGALKKIGLAEGKIFDRSLLDKIQLDLQRQYFSRGYYSVQVDTEIKDAGMNRSDIQINVKEGVVAEIKQINIVGNKVFDQSDLMKDFQSGVGGFFSSNDQYSRQKLTADLETLRSYYLDRGYINFNIESSQVNISRDRKSVYIAINVTEGDQYTVSAVDLAGDLIIDKEELRKLIKIAPGEVFSRRKVTESANAITERLGRDGYAFANVNSIPDLDKDKKLVALNFFIDPGKRISVRRINISGNAKTEDEVVRREFRQMESAWLASDKLERSRVRVQRLGYLSDVTVETPLVPGSNDVVDVDMAVTEEPSGSLMVGLGYSGGSGLLLNASVSQNNFLGTGKRVVTEINSSKVSKVYSFSHTDPYFTLDGVSRTTQLYFRKTDTSATSVAEYVENQVGGVLNFGIPITEYDSIRLGIGYENSEIKQTTYTPQAYLDYLAANGSRFSNFKLTVGWTHDTRDRTVFPTSGMMQSLSSDITTPGSDLNYYKIYSKTEWYYPLTSKFTLSLNGDLSYGERYGSTSDVPFFEKFYAGGPYSVRGYRSNSLGPVAGTLALGGNFRVVGNAGLVFPPPFVEDSKTVRLTTFFDIGNVFANARDFSGGELRQSAGVSLLWLSPIGPLSFSLARPLNNQVGDRTESFQFTLGSFF